MSKLKTLIVLRVIHTPTISVWATRNTGLPKKRAKPSALRMAQIGPEGRLWMARKRPRPSSTATPVQQWVKVW